MGIVLELNLSFFQNPVSFDINLLRPVDENVADARVLHEGLQWPQAEDLVKDLKREPLSILCAKWHLHTRDDFLDRRQDLRAALWGRDAQNLPEFDLALQIAMDAILQFLIGLEIEPAGKSFAR
jgi:hypothetical protein